MVKRLKAFAQEDETEIQQLRLKRGLFLLLGAALFLGGVKILAGRGAVSSAIIPFDQEQLIDLGRKVLSRSQSVLEREVNDGKDEGLGESISGEVVGVVQDGREISQPRQEIVEKRVEEIIKIIKSLPEEQAEAIKKEVMRGICEEVCRTE